MSNDFYKKIKKSVKIFVKDYVNAMEKSAALTCQFYNCRCNLETDRKHND